LARRIRPILVSPRRSCRSPKRTTRTPPPAPGGCCQPPRERCSPRSSSRAASPPRHAIPRDGRIAAAVHYFVNTFNTSGLVGFIESTGWDEGLCEEVREGLSRLAFDELVAIFAGLEDFMAHADPESFEDGEWVSDPVLQELDARFTPAIPVDRCYEQLAAWIRGWPSLRGVPGAEFQTVLKAMSEGNRGPA
jgi:hypothetical protein